MNILGRQILIKPILKKESVIITSDKPELTDRATIVGIGNEVPKGSINKDDLVLFNNRAGMPVIIDNEDFILTDVVNIYIVL